MAESGRELYTSPFIWVTEANIEQTSRKDSYGNSIYTCRDKFVVEAIQIENKEITGLAIKNLSLKGDKKRVFVYKK